MLSRRTRKRPGPASGPSRDQVEVAQAPSARGPLLAAAPHRRLFHLVAASLFPTFYLFFPRTPVLVAALALLAASVAGEWLRFKHPGFNAFLLARLRPLTKETEAHSPFGSTHLLAATALVIGTMSQPVAVLALFYLSIGDPLAALVGERIGSHRVVGKSLEGSAAFLAGALAIGGALLAAGPQTTAPVMLVGAVAATLLEIAPLGLDDNVKVPLGAGGAMSLANHFWG